ncbi:MAG TPA: hypothetical protein VMU95_41110 [Trebonia sp.]|nr:hypothetical protein [Trebonia sp.]
MGRRGYCDQCQMQPCIGGRGPGSCTQGKKGAGERRSEKAGPPENTVKHTHDYRVVNITTDVVRDGRKRFSVQTKTSKCFNRKGECTRPEHVDVTRIRID